jgi:hypothetical protein
VPGHKVKPGLNRDVDLRNIWVIDLSDTKGRFPKSQRLEEVLRQFEAAIKELREARRDFGSEQNGSVNEQQHAYRLVSLLHGESCGTLDKRMVDDQNARRIVYEVAHRRIRSLLLKSTLLHGQVAIALREAVKEAHENGVDCKTPRMAINQEAIDIELRVINNALAADLVLRTFGREMAQQSRDLTDVSHGAGNRALEAEFESVAGRFRPGIKRDAQ